MRMRRPYQDAVQLAIELDVGDKASSAAQKLVVLDAADGRADALVRRC